MEYVDGLINLITKKFKRPERQLKPEGWGYEMYREYLLAVSRGRDYLLPIEDYPSRIELSQQWHDTFNQIRSKPYESWALVGYEEGQRRLVLPAVAEKGLSHSVPNDVQFAAMNKARLKAGVTDMVGNIHSHPRRNTDSSWNIPSQPTSEGHGNFSLGDLYYLLSYISRQRPSDPVSFFMFVTEGNENIGAFGTRGALERTRNSFNESSDQFAEKWYRKFGWKYNGREEESEGGGELAEQVDKDAKSIWTINRAVAHHYQIALYRGFTNGPLLRNYPTKLA
jgi:hypothetical protein